MSDVRISELLIKEFEKENLKDNKILMKGLVEDINFILNESLEQVKEEVKLSEEKINKCKEPFIDYLRKEQKYQEDLIKEHNDLVAMNVAELEKLSIDLNLKKFGKNIIVKLKDGYAIN